MIKNGLISKTRKHGYENGASGGNIQRNMLKEIPQSVLLPVIKSGLLCCTNVGEHNHCSFGVGTKRSISISNHSSQPTMLGHSHNQWDFSFADIANGETRDVRLHFGEGVADRVRMTYIP